jgi:hypothetical protein
MRRTLAVGRERTVRLRYRFDNLQPTVTGLWLARPVGGAGQSAQAYSRYTSAPLERQEPVGTWRAREAGIAGALQPLRTAGTLLAIVVAYLAAAITLHARSARAPGKRRQRRSPPPPRRAGSG